MKYRLWYPQLDIYDAMRRLCLLLDIWRDKPQGQERLYIADFFLANPCLLHKSQMPQDMKRSFTSLRIAKPEKSFINFPSSQLLFKQMEPLQKKALSTLMSKGIAIEDELKSGRIKLTEKGQNFMTLTSEQLKTQDEGNLLPFLCESYILINPDNIEILRKKTGLRRPI